MTMDRDPRTDLRQVREAADHDTTHDAGSTASPAAHRQASMAESMDVLEAIMDERADVFRRLAQ